MHFPAHVLRTFKHHVLEQMRKSCPPRSFVGRTNVIPEIHRHERQGVILGQDHLQPVFQFVFLERNRGKFLGRVLRDGGRGRANRQQSPKQNHPGQNSLPMEPVHRRPPSPLSTEISAEVHPAAPPSDRSRPTTKPHRCRPSLT